MAKIGTVQNSKEHEIGPLNLMTKAQYNEWNEIQSHPKVIAAKQLYEPVEKKIKHLIETLENGSGLTDAIFDEINMCIVEIQAIEQAIHEAESFAESEFYKIKLAENNQNK